MQGKAYLTRVTLSGQATPITPAARPALRCRCKAPAHVFLVCGEARRGTAPMLLAGNTNKSLHYKMSLGARIERVVMREVEYCFTDENIYRVHFV